MTTAPDLPLPTARIPLAVPGDAVPTPYPADPALTPTAPDRPTLSVVPAQPSGEETIELDDALRRAGPRLKRYAVRRLHDEHEAEEVVQEAMLRAFQHRHL